MSRRGFLGLLDSTAGALLLGGKRVAAPAPVALSRCYVAGFQYHQGLTLLPRLREGQALVLSREPENPYDPLVIAVHTATGAKLVYLPRWLNEIPVGLMDWGQRIMAVIAAVGRNAPSWDMVAVEVVMEQGGWRA
jgi:hypothetical protein